MGRGRAKAKQTRVARELKYSSPNTDLTALGERGVPAWVAGDVRPRAAGGPAARRVGSYRG